MMKDRQQTTMKEQQTMVVRQVRQFQAEALVVSQQLQQQKDVLAERVVQQEEDIADLQRRLAEQQAQTRLARSEGAANALARGRGP